MATAEPTPPAALLAQLAMRAHGATLLVGAGQYGPGGEVSRVCVLEVGRRRPRLLWDGPLAEADLPRVHEQLAALAAEVRRGEFDTMYATPWTLAWTLEGRWQAWQRRGRLAEQRDDHLCIDRPLRSPVMLPRTELVRVRGWVAEGWVRRGVSIDLAHGDSQVLVERSDSFAALDPTYDGLNLLADCSWIVGFGRSLALALGIEYRGDDLAVR